MELYYTSKPASMNQSHPETTESLGYGSGGFTGRGPGSGNRTAAEWSQAGYESSESHYPQSQYNAVRSYAQTQSYQPGDGLAARPPATGVSSARMSQVPLSGGAQRPFAGSYAGSAESWSGGGGSNVVRPGNPRTTGIMHAQGSYAQRKLLQMTGSDEYSDGFSEAPATNNYKINAENYEGSAMPLSSPSRPAYFGQRTGVRQPRFQSIAPGMRSGSAAAYRAPVRPRGAAQSYGSAPPRGTAVPLSSLAGRGVTRPSGLGSRPAGTSWASSPRLNLIHGSSPAASASALRPVAPATTVVSGSATSSPAADKIESTDEPNASSEKQNTDEKNEGKEKDDEDGDDDDDDVDMSGCKLCGIKFEKVQAFHVHIRSTSHNQKVEAQKKEKMKLKGIDSSSSANSSAATASTATASSAADTARKDDHYCYVCNFPFSNAEVFNSHLQGLLHLRRLEEQKKATKVSALDEEEYDEDSQDSLAYSSNKKIDWSSVTEKDLNPDDIGKPGSTQYMCDVCSVSCTGLKSFEMHIAGAKHLKKLKKVKDLEEFEEKKKQGMEPSEDLLKSKKKRKVVRAQQILDLCTEPLIGLDYMTEFQFEDMNVEPRYICDLCQCKMDMRQIIAHVTGIRHRHKYFKYHSIREYNILWNIRRKSDKVKTATKFATETEAREGRHTMRLKMQLTPFAEKTQAMDNDEWTEIEDSHARARSALPGLGTFNELSATYKDVQDGDEDDEDDEPNVVSVPDLGTPRKPAPQPLLAMEPSYRPPSPGRSRPLQPAVRQPGVMRPRYPQAEPYRENRGPPIMPRRGGYTPEPPPRRPLVSDPYYQRYPAYNRDNYDYSYPGSASYPAPASSYPPSASNLSSSSSNNLEKRAVINYDHQSLTKTDDRRGIQNTVRGDGDAVRPRYPDPEERTVSKETRTSATPAKASGVAAAAINIDLIKTAIAQCNIDTEADAELALQISNSLTQALLEYRLSSLARAGSSDPALEQHLKNLREQNAELMTVGQHPQTSNFMYSALRATQVLAARIPDGDQETIKQAMSVLDAVNLQLYGMLGKNDSSKKSEDVESAPGTSLQRNLPPTMPTSEVSARHRVDFDEGNERAPAVAPQRSAVSSAVRPPSKRFRFGL